MRYLVGIDLGTTNSALAYIDLQNKPKVGNLGLKTFAVPQLVAPGQMGERALLPSFLYLPGQHDLPPGSVALPWDANAGYAVGEFARNHGAKVPGRLVSSAKSWLCHAGVDRTAPLLPWTAPPDVPRLSPLEVSTRYLKHFVQGWNHMPNRAEADHLENQTVVLTVPASFDDVARNHNTGREGSGTEARHASKSPRRRSIAGSVERPEGVTRSSRHARLVVGGRRL